MARPRTGTLTQRGPALWRLQVTSNGDRGPGAEPGAKRRLSRTFRGSKAEALAALHRLIVEAGCDLHGGSTATVAVLLAQFMATASLAPTTRADWQCVVDNQLVPALGDIPLWRLTARDCDELYSALKDDGLGPSRVRCAHVVLHRDVTMTIDPSVRQGPDVLHQSRIDGQEQGQAWGIDAVMAYLAAGSQGAQSGQSGAAARFVDGLDDGSRKPAKHSARPRPALSPCRQVQPAAGSGTRVRGRPVSVGALPEPSIWATSRAFRTPAGGS